MRNSARSLPDTNVIIRYLTRDQESLFLEAKDFFDGVKEGTTRATLLESVIAESIHVLTKIYRVPGEQAAASLIDILHYRGIDNPDRQELIQALSLFAKRKLDIVDCILCVKSAGPDASLFTFDRELIKLRNSCR